MQRRTVAVVCGTLLIFLTSLLPAASAYADSISPPVSIDMQGVSQEPITVTVTSALPEEPYLAGAYFIATWINGKGDISTAVTTAQPDGSVSYTINLWKSSTITIVSADNPTVPLHLIRTTIAPPLQPVSPPPKAPLKKPQYRTNLDGPAVGHGPHPAITRITPAQRQRMTGITWHTGCIPLNELRELHINYWGTDGYRHRGLIIVRDDTAHRAAKMLSALYRIHYRFHSIHPVDQYGRNPHGPGGNDYASMQAGNTSMFNCRYLVGKERQRQTSPHSSGRTIDINPWENPYVSSTGIYPNSWWRHHTNSPLSFRRNNQARLIIQRHRWQWGAGYGDYHHFQR